MASLTRRFGDLDIAEEAAAEAFAVAVERWPADGVPPNPGAWLTTTANRKAIDRIRRENKRDDKQREAQVLYDDPPERLGAIDDDRLRLIFTCCHPALAMEARVALTLRMVGGLTVPEIARAFLVQESTMGRRITRAKDKIRDARIPYRVPSADDLPARVSGVLAVLFLVFNEGYLATGPDTDPVRPDLTAEAIRLTRLIHALVPEDGEVVGLLALMLLTESRRTARISADGELVALADQDRATWDVTLIAEGHGLVRGRLATGVAAGRYQILAAINAVHTSARHVSDTDWSQVIALYDQLVRLDPSPIVALNRAVAVAELDGPEVALATVDRLDGTLGGYHAYHATRADLLRRLGRRREARMAYDTAIQQAGNSAEIAYLTRRRDELPDMPSDTVSATLAIRAGAATVFAVLADPTTHAAVDGTGWVQEAVDTAPLVEPGQVFRMGMYHAGHPDGDYQIANQVEVFDPPHAIRWRPGVEKDDGHLEFGGWTWRYDLVPLGPAETDVTLTYDWSVVPESIRAYLQFPPFGPAHLSNSLRHLAELAATRERHA